MTIYATDGTIGFNASERVAGTGTSNDQGNQFSLGQMVDGSGGTKWMYVHASAAIAANAWVAIDADGEVASLTDTLLVTGQAVGIATAAFADNDFGWVCVYAGQSSDVAGLVAASCAADIALYTSTVAGVLDDATSIGSRVFGAVIIAANTAGAAAAEQAILNWPTSVNP